MTARTKSYLILLFVSAIWGIAGPVIKFTVGQIPPFVFLTYRFLISGVIGLIGLAITPLHWPTKPHAKLYILVYCFLTTTISLGLLFVGYQYTSALTGSILTALSPIMTAAIGVALLHEHVTRREKLGMSIALAGTLLITFEPSPLGNSLLGNFLIILSLVLGLALSVMAKEISRNYPKVSPLGLTHLSFVVGFITILPFTLTQHSPFTILHSLLTAPPSAHLGVWYMALFSGTLAYWLWEKAQRTIEIGETAVFSYLVPFFTVPLSYFWLHESISTIFIISCLVTAAGIVIAETKPHRPTHRPKRRR